MCAAHSRRGQNALNDLLPQQFSKFPIPPAMAATFNMSAVASLGRTPVLGSWGKNHAGRGEE